MDSSRMLRNMLDHIFHSGRFDTYTPMTMIIIDVDEWWKIPEREIIENFFAEDPEYSYHYALTIGGRWPKGEKSILTDPIHTYLYARHVIKSRWPEGEETLVRDAYWTYWYIRDVLRGRGKWPEGDAVSSSMLFQTRSSANHGSLQTTSAWKNGESSQRGTS